MADKYMETLDYGSEFLAHYGIKGMKWDASKKKSPAEVLAEALKKKRKEALIKRAAATGTEYIRKRARDAVIDRLSASIARATTPRPSSPDNQHKTNQIYDRRNLEESAKRVESKKRNSRFNAKKDASNKKENVITENVITENVITEKSDKPLSDFKNKITEMAKKQAAKERQVEDRMQESKGKERRMAEERAMDAEKTRREKTHQARVAEDKRLKEEARKKRRSDFDQYVDSRLNGRRKDNVRRALAKAAKQTKYR